MNRVKEYRYSEIFRSIQGEGNYTGVPTIWYRAWGCNFNCSGFGQKDPSDKNSWILPYKDIDISDIKRVEDLPVFEYGCDSSYSWAKKFSHLAHKYSAKTIAEKLRDLLPNRKFKTPTGLDYHLAFTGGEPMLSQTAIVDIVQNLDYNTTDIPHYITIETNGTQIPRPEFTQFFRYEYGRELFWSCSPKLSASGESWNKAIQPRVLEAYNKISSKGQLKFVVDGSEKCWNEVEKAVEIYYNHNVYWPVWIMPVGATLEEQESIQKEICNQCLERGYNFSPRVHCWIFGNTIGT